MKEIEITFKKRFKMCDDQDPKDCARMYIETMGFEVVDIQDLNGRPRICREVSSGTPEL